MKNLSKTKTSPNQKHTQNKKPLPRWAKWTIFCTLFVITIILICILVWQLVLKHVA